jgi:hypothetical protein
MLDSESPSTRYRRLAQECWETAHTFPDGERRIALLQMAQVWQRLAVDHADSTPLLRPIEGEGPAMQQQQQVQPKDNDKKE